VPGTRITIALQFFESPNPKKSLIALAAGNSVAEAVEPVRDIGTNVRKKPEEFTPTVSF
jgi:hypothetical protein